MKGSDDSKINQVGLEVIENLLDLMAKKENELQELYEDLSKAMKLGVDPTKGEVNNNIGIILGEGEKIKALVADKIPTMRTRLKEILASDESCIVVGEAANGDELWANYLKFKPGIIITEIELPTADEGSAVLGKIKEHNPNVVLIITCRDVTDMDILMRVSTLGAFDFVSKPVNHHRLLRAVEKIKSAI